MKEVFYLDESYREPARKHHVTLKFGTVFYARYRTFAGMGCMILLSVPVAILTVGFLISLMLNDHNYAVNGIETQATTTDCIMGYAGRGSSRPQITYHYVVDAITYTGRHSVDAASKTCADFPSGVLLTAKYLPDAVNRSIIIDELANDPAWDIWYMLIVYGGLGCAACLAIVLTLGAIDDLVYTLRTAIRYRRLLKHGVLLNGEIVKSTGRLRGRNDSLYYLHIRYQFTTPDGRTLARTQSRERTDLRFYPLPEPGTPIKVLYTDDNAVVML